MITRTVDGIEWICMPEVAHARIGHLDATIKYYVNSPYEFAYDIIVTDPTAEHDRQLVVLGCGYPTMHAAMEEATQFACAYLLRRRAI